MIELEKVSKTFDGQTQVLKPTSLSIQKNEFLVLIGPSGCGKTTLLRIIAGLEEPTAGKVLIDEKDVTWSEPKNRQVAMVFQNYALYPHLRVAENLEYPLKMLPLSKKQRLARLLEVAKSLQIETLLKRYPNQLSGGQKQRVAIGRALVRNPKVFLFDEPLSNLDARLREQMRLEIAEFHQRVPVTTIYVTHDQHEAMTLGDRLVVLNQGQVEQIGTPLELYEKPQSVFVASFLGQPPVNVLKGQLDAKKQFSGDFGVWDLKHCAVPEAAGKQVYIGIRPEKMHLVSKTSKDAVAEVKLSRTENLGAETHVYVESRTQTFCIRTTAEGFKQTEDLAISFDAKDLLWFDEQQKNLNFATA